MGYEHEVYIQQRPLFSVIGYKFYLLLRCYREYTVDEGAVSDHLEPGVREPGRGARPDDPQRMAERRENLHHKHYIIPQVSMTIRTQQIYITKHNRQSIM